MRRGATEPTSLLLIPSECTQCVARLGMLGSRERGTWRRAAIACCARCRFPSAPGALHAVGAAMAAQRLDEDSRDGGTFWATAPGRGDVHGRSISRRCSPHRACSLYQNNQWAISRCRYPGGPRTIYRAQGGASRDAEGIQVDSNDVLACYAVMAEAAAPGSGGDG